MMRDICIERLWNGRPASIQVPPLSKQRIETGTVHEFCKNRTVLPLKGKTHERSEDRSEAPAWLG